MSTDDPDEVVRLATAMNSAEAHVWCDALEAEGIRCRVVGDYLEASYGGLSGTRPEIWVRRADVPRAEEVLRRDLQGGEPPAEEGEDEDEG
jgi:hypothetical protein